MATTDHLRTIAITHIDNAGISRVKTIPASRLDKVTATGATVSTSVAMLFAVDDWPVSTERLQAVVGDLRLIPDIRRLAVIDAETGLGWLPASLYGLDGAPFEGCARGLLERIVDRAAESGLELSFGVELEFTVHLPDGSPAHAGPGYGVRPFLDLESFHVALMNTLVEAGVQVEQLHPEYGVGQLELSFSPTDPVAAIDELALARFVVQRTAKQHGLRASFAPMPVLGSVGNGLHLHFSARRDGRNLFADPDGDHGVSAAGASMITGVLSGLRGGAALLGGSTGSYLRLRPQSWSGSWVCWGDGNREAAVRLMRGYRGAEDAQANVEVKCVDGASNPYLAAAWILATALRGLESDAPATQPVLADPATMSEADRAAAGVTAFPTRLDEALDLLAEDPAAPQILGELLLEVYLAVRRRDAEVFAGASDAEVVAANLWRV